MTTATLLLSADELHAVTGYRQPSAQLGELRRQGFVRARRDRLGRVVLERAHYIAVCAGSCDHCAAAIRARTTAPETPTD